MCIVNYIFSVCIALYIGFTDIHRYIICSVKWMNTWDSEKSQVLQSSFFFAWRNILHSWSLAKRLAVCSKLYTTLQFILFRYITNVTNVTKDMYATHTKHITHKIHVTLCHTHTYALSAGNTEVHTWAIHSQGSKRACKATVRAVRDPSNQPDSSGGADPG